MLHHGRFFEITPFDKGTNKPWDVDKIENIILQIENVAEVKGPNNINSIGVLTTLDRKTWAKVWIMEHIGKTYEYKILNIRYSNHEIIHTFHR